MDELLSISWPSKSSLVKLKSSDLMSLLLLKSKDSMTPGRPLSHFQEPLPYKVQLKHGLRVFLLEHGQIDLSPYKTGL